MAICGDPTGTAIVGGDGVFISGSGTPGDPWVINLVEPSDFADLEADVANLQALSLTLPATYVNVTGDTMTGALTISSTGQQLKLVRTDADAAHVGFYESTGVTRQAYINSTSSGLDIWDNQGYVRLVADGTEILRCSSGGRLLVHKTASSAGTEGFDFAEGGQFESVRTSVGINVLCNKSGDANVNGQVYASFEQAGTPIGTITRASGSAVAYNETSDRDLKENIVPIDDDLALLWLRIVEPVFYNYIEEPGVPLVGYIAQDTNELWPNCVPNGVVRPGHGDVADRTWDDDGNETTPKEVWESWQVAYGRTTPLLHSAMKSLDRVIEARTVVLDDHATRIAELETIVAAQADRLTALEAAMGGATIGALRDEMFYTRTMTAGWQFSNTATPPPGAGQLRMNTANTEMYLHKTDTDGYSRAASMNFIVARTALDPDCVRFRIRGTSGSVLELRTSGPVVDNSTYLTVPFSILSGTAADKGFRVEITLLSEIWSEDPPI